MFDLLRMLLLLASPVALAQGDTLLEMEVCLDHFDAPQRAGQLAALVQGAGYLIAGVSPWVAGLLRDSLGSFTGAWLGLTAVAALLLGLGLRFDPRRYAALFAERQARGVGAESLR